MVSVVWTPDEAVTGCQQCGVGFSFLLRRHHCRVCGEVVCGSCIRNSRVTMEWQQGSKQLKVCKGCRGAAWMPDGDASTCRQCESPFTMTTRRHHCRKCGRIFCSSCCAFKKDLPTSPGKVQSCRVCWGCSDSSEAVSYSHPPRQSFFRRVLGIPVKPEDQDDDLSLGSQDTPSVVELDNIMDHDEEEDEQVQNRSDSAERPFQAPSSPASSKRSGDEDDDCAVVLGTPPAFKCNGKKSSTNTLAVPAVPHNPSFVGLDDLDDLQVGPESLFEKLSYLSTEPA
eukprot:TRINITY_DN5502_c0_g1_i2.p1 TRINITY_DN5502_c0_g1~~TRINITY_DN5502_c0_g1_i2.p1  ORF type:complete len:292 (+),score=33.25 TRINITY_DN5502_c0_g1_i2:30-878(+)